jgi:hypothetical protein
MNTTKTAEIDYLFEDPEISSQRYGLISIVGPNMPQKCDVWGLKIRGVADSIERAKSMTQKLMNIDKDYDIYTVEIGKFFPLVVNPLEIDTVEYQNEQLNQLIKGYLESKELANQQWAERKNEMMKQAILDGKNQEERGEHPVAVLQRIEAYRQTMVELEGQLQNAKENLKNAEMKFSGYTQEEQQSAKKQFNKDSETGVDSTLENLKLVEQERQKLSDLKMTLSESDSEQLQQVNKKLEECNVRETELTKELQDKKRVNDYINSNYTNSNYDSLVNNVNVI